MHFSLGRCINRFMSSYYQSKGGCGSAEKVVGKMLSSKHYFKSDGAVHMEHIVLVKYRFVVKNTNMSPNTPKIKDHIYSKNSCIFSFNSEACS